MKRIIALVAVGIILAPITTMAATVFNRSLRQGDSGADVVALQQLLNKNSQTQVAVSGAGSPGQESSYFGAKTKQAVVRFQELHAAEVLTPSGLAFGTGFVGPRTLLKLNSLSGAAVSPVNPVTTIFSLSPSSALPGEVVSVYGDKFGSEPLTVKFGKLVLPAKKHPNATNEVSFSIPNGTASGIYTVSVNSSDGLLSNNLKVRVVGSGPALTGSAASPYITQLSPSRGGYGTVLTILGSGFSVMPDNTVTVAATVFTGIASPDGRTLSVVLPRDMEGLTFDAEVLSGLTPEVPIGVKVENSTGESDVADFTFTFYQS